MTDLMRALLRSDKTARLVHIFNRNAGSSFVGEVILAPIDAVRCPFKFSSSMMQNYQDRQDSS